MKNIGENIRRFVFGKFAKNVVNSIKELEWTEESVCMAFEALRSRRTAGKIVLRM